MKSERGTLARTKAAIQSEENIGPGVRAQALHPSLCSREKEKLKGRERERERRQRNE